MALNLAGLRDPNQPPLDIVTPLLQARKLSITEELGRADIGLRRSAQDIERRRLDLEETKQLAVGQKQEREKKTAAALSVNEIEKQTYGNSPIPDVRYDSLVRRLETWNKVPGVNVPIPDKNTWVENEKEYQKLEEETTLLFNQIKTGEKKIDDPAIGAGLASIAARAKKLGRPMTEELAEQKALLDKPPAPQRPVSLAPGSKLVDPITGEEITRGLSKTPTAGSATERSREKIQREAIEHYAQGGKKRVKDYLLSIGFDEDVSERRATGIDQLLTTIPKEEQEKSWFKRLIDAVFGGEDQPEENPISPIVGDVESPQNQQQDLLPSHVRPKQRNLTDVLGF
jgi:hypothetical protein